MIKIRKTNNIIQHKHLCESKTRRSALSEHLVSLYKTTQNKITIDSNIPEHSMCDTASFYWQYKSG